MDLFTLIHFSIPPTEAALHFGCAVLSQSVPTPLFIMRVIHLYYNNYKMQHRL